MSNAKRNAPVDDIGDDPERLLAESRRLTDKISATRREWAAGKGNDYGTALDYIISQRRRRAIIGQLRAMFRVAD